MKKILFAAVVATLIGTPVLAADMPLKAPPPAPVAAYNWTGWYVGGNVGYGWGRNTGAGWTSFTDAGVPFGVAGYFGAGGNGLPGVNPKGVLGGGQIGYDWQVSPTTVLGLVADLDASGMRGSAAAQVTPGFFDPTTQTNAAQLKWLGTFRAKAGFTSNNWLIYATGGLAYGRVNEQNAMNCAACGPPQFFAGSSSSTRAGGTVGAGLEYGLAANWTVGAEYLWFDLGKISTTATLTAGTNTLTTFTSQAKFDGSIARAFVNYKF
jgi:outer membrane immunogenic protein